MFARGLSLGLRVGLLVVVGLAVALSLFGYLSLRSLQASSERALNERLAAAELTAHHLDAFLGLYLDFLVETVNAGGPGLLGPDPAAARAVLRQLEMMPGKSAYGAYIINRQGVVTARDPDSMPDGPAGLPGFDLAAQAVEGGKGCVSGALPYGDGKFLIALAVPILGTEGYAKGAAVSLFSLSEPFLGGAVGQVVLGKTGYADIVDSNGLVLSSSDVYRLFQKSDHTDQFAGMIQAGRPTVGGCHECHGSPGSNHVIPDILAFAPLSSAPWGVAIRQSEEEALGPTRELQRSLAVAAAITLLVAVGVVVIGSREVVRPVRELTLASRRIAAGDLESRLNSTGPAEVGELARAFDEMREKLKDSLNSLEQARSGLEINVDQRTRQLSALLGVSKVLAGTLDLRQLLDAIVGSTAEVLDLADAGLVALYNEGLDRLEVRAAWGYGEEIRRLSIAPGEGLQGLAFTQGEPILLSNVDAVRRVSATLTPENWAWRAQARKWLDNTSSAMALPLVVKGRVTGVMSVEHFRDEGAFSEADLRLAQALADQIAVAMENSRLYREVLEKEQLRGELLDKVIAAQEEERRRIARELHDDTCQSLAALGLSLAEVEESLPESAGPARAALARVAEQVQATLAEVRALALNLRPSMLDDLGLRMAIDWYAKDQLAKRGLEVKLELEGLDRELQPALETVLFRIAQEALNNVVKHSGASSATVRLVLQDLVVVLEVEDDGLGFDVDRVLHQRSIAHSLGLHGMIERAALSGGDLRVHSSPGRGTLVRAELPLNGVES